MIDDVQFNAWFNKAFRGEGTTSERAMCRYTWLEATRLADRAAREECCWIIEENVKFADGQPAINAIRDTIKEEPSWPN